MASNGLKRRMRKKRPRSTIADGKGGRVNVWPCVICGAWNKTRFPGWCSEQCRHALEVRDALREET